MKNLIYAFLQSWLPGVYRTLVAGKKRFEVWRFKKKYPNVKLFDTDTDTDTESKFYSQHGQDQLVFESFFKGKRSGFFCDIGGNHPLTINNTRYFEELGWQGVAFEPLPHMKELWEMHRKARLFPLALSSSEGLLSFVIVESESGWEDMLSFVKGTGGVDEKRPTREIEVLARRFSDVAREEGITHIDYLSLDVEGHELHVLEGIDFDEVQIDVLTIENNPPLSHVYGDDNIRELMLSKGYQFWGRIVGLDDIYVRQGFVGI